MKVSSVSLLRWRGLVLLLPALLLIACSSSPKAPEPKPYPKISGERLSLKKLWRLSVDDGVDGGDLRLTPAIGERDVYAASVEGLLLAADRQTGKRHWKRETEQAFTAGPAAGYGLVLMGTAKGEVQAYGAEDGALKWKAALGAAILAAPAVAADTVVVLSADGVIHALAADTGALRWTYDTAVPPLSLHAAAAPLIDGNRVYVGTAGGRLLGLDLHSGVAGMELRVATNNGRTELERMTDIVASPLLGDDGSLYSVGFQSQLSAVDAASGRRRWQLDLSSVNELAEGLGNVYASDVDGNVVAVDQASGKVLWKQPDFAWRKLSNPVVVDNVLAVGDNDGYVHLLAQSDGQVRGRRSVTGGALRALLVRDAVLYCWDDAGRLSAWTLQSH